MSDTLQTVMPLEDWQLDSLENWLRGAAKEDALGCVLVCKDEVLSLIAMARSALHHLEAGKRSDHWIPLSEQKPTRADADTEGKVLFLYEPAGYHYCDYWDELSDHTHWKPLPNYALSTTPTVEVQS